MEGWHQSAVHHIQVQSLSSLTKASKAIGKGRAELFRMVRKRVIGAMWPSRDKQRIACFQGSRLVGPRWGHASDGFTIIEAIMVILVIGILASILMYRYDTSRDTSATVAVNSLVADIQYVRAKAMAAGAPQSISFSVGSGVYNLSGEQKRLPDGVMVTATTLPADILTFNTLGEPTFGISDRTITLTGPRTITVRAITGSVE